MNARYLALSTILTLAMGLARPVTAEEGSALPESFPPDRYSAIKQSSPFALATAAAEKAEPNFARDMFISGVARIGQKNLVSITTQDKTKSYTLMTGDPPVNGIQLQEVIWKDELGKTTVHITKGGEFATLQFNEMVVRAPAAMTAMPQPQANRGIPNVRPPNVQQPNVPRVINVAPQNPVSGDGQSRRRIIRRPSR